MAEKHTFRCGTSIFIRHHDWAAKCEKQKHSMEGCECGKPRYAPDPEKMRKERERRAKRDPFRRRK